MLKFDEYKAIDDFGLIFDRTIADVNHVINLYKKGWNNMTDTEKLEWQSDLKGALNYSDLNRVESATEWINTKLREFGYDKPLKIKKDWKESDMQDVQLMLNYCTNVIKVISSIKNSFMASIPSNMNNANYITQNNIEKNLFLMREVLISILSGMRELKFTLSGDEFE